MVWLLLGLPNANLIVPPYIVCVTLHPIPQFLFPQGRCRCCMSPNVPIATTPLCCAQAISTRPLLVMYVATGQQNPYAALKYFAAGDVCCHWPGQQIPYAALNEVLKYFAAEAADQRWSGTTLGTPCNKDLNCAPIREPHCKPLPPRNLGNFPKL